MRSLVAALLVLTAAAPLQPQEQQPQQPQPSRAASCGETPALHQTREYYDAVVDGIYPPIPASRGITITIGEEKKLALHTDGEKFQLWTDTMDVHAKNVWDFLDELDNACSLPSDPADAVKLLNINWESRDLSEAQFEQLHEDFMSALSRYVPSVEERSAYFMKTKYLGGGVDAKYYRIVYDNSWQHFEIQDWDLPIDHRIDPMIDWVHELQKTAETSFHRPFGREK